MISAPFAHIAGIPIEEGALTLAPAAGAIAVLISVRVRGLLEWLRHRQRIESGQG
jgi:hypothetical protein